MPGCWWINPDETHTRYRCYLVSPISHSVTDPPNLMFLSGSRLFPPHLFFHHCRFMLSETILITCIYIHLRLIGFCYKTLTGFIYIKNIYFKLERVSASRSRIMLMCQQNKAVTSLLLCPHMFLIHDLTFYCQYFSTVESFNLGVSGFKTGFSCLLLSPFTGRTL